MVKVLPTAFALFENQNIFNTTLEPICVYCSDQYVFVACEGCVVEAHDLHSKEQISRLRTIWPVNELLYNEHGDCILTLERRTPESSAAARLYFKWRGIRELEKPTKVFSLSASTESPASSELDTEIMELPAENASCIAVCKLTGVIAVGSKNTVKLFLLNKSTLTSSGHTITSYMDIRTDMKLKKIHISGNYLACISTHRLRVLKLLILGTLTHPWSGIQTSDPLERTVPPTKPDLVNDSNFIRWSPSYVWEMEAKSLNSQRAPPTDSIRNSATNSTSSDAGSRVEAMTTSVNSLAEGDIHLMKEMGSTSSFNVRGSQSSLTTLSLPTIKHAINTAKSNKDKHELEILGPVEYVWGHPLTVTFHCGDDPDRTWCWPLTMLYKRFPSTGHAYVHVSAETRIRSATMTSGERRPTEMVTKKSKGGLHTVQLVPTMAGGESTIPPVTSAFLE